MEFIYVQLDDKDYGVGISCLSGEVQNKDLIQIDRYDNSYIGRRYDRLANEWTNQYVELEPLTKPMSEHEQVTKHTHNNVEVSSFDNLINMDMLIALDEKLNKILEHLGL